MISLLNQQFITFFRLETQSLKICYFEDTDTLYIEFKVADIEETKELDENTLLDVDSQGNIVAITVEHASKRTDIQQLTLSGIAA